MLTSQPSLMCLTTVERKPNSCDNVGTAGSRATQKELGHRYQKESVLCTLGCEEDVPHTVPCDNSTINTLLYQKRYSQATLFVAR